MLLGGQEGGNLEPHVLGCPLGPFAAVLGFDDRIFHLAGPRRVLKRLWDLGEDEVVRGVGMRCVACGQRVDGLAQLADLELVDGARLARREERLGVEVLLLLLVVAVLVRDALRLDDLDDRAAAGRDGRVVPAEAQDDLDLGRLVVEAGDDGRRQAAVGVDEVAIVHSAPPLSEPWPRLAHHVAGRRAHHAHGHRERLEELGPLDVLEVASLIADVLGGVGVEVGSPLPVP